MVNIKNLSKSYGEINIFKNFNLSFEKNKTYVILGPSGIGKSTLLNMIAGIDKDYTGEISVNSKNISYVFQEDRLLPWLSVEENINFVLEEEKDIDSILEILEIKNLKHKTVKQLSGGQKQRVAIARAFAREPHLVLMDESLKSLDLNLKYSIIDEIVTLSIKKNTTMIYVSHDMEEALLTADSIIIFDKEGSISNIMDIPLPKEGRRHNREKLLKYELALSKKLIL
jgi:NitT/TauT family transport system ATP-binding protein